MGRPYLLGETTWKIVRQTDYQVAILPWGATEAHNYHLPYATDNIQNEYIAAESARLAWDEGARVVVLPNIPFGVNTGQLDVKLDINMMPSTQLSVLHDVSHALAGQGIQKLVILNGHGGNDFKQMVREVGARVPEIFICIINWYKVLDGQMFFDDPGDHAGEMETSNLLHIAPELVLSLSEAGTGGTHPFRLEGLRSGWVWAERVWRKATDDTGSGNPALATAEKGAKFLETLTQKIAGFMVELAACDTANLYERQSA